MRRESTIWIAALALTSACVSLLALPSPASACGGLFCAQAPPTPSPPLPIDQTAERIIFEVNEEAEEITAHVQIQYVGPAEDFAWVVPVPGVPEVAESSDQTFVSVDQLTALQVLMPTADPCPSVGSSGSSGCIGCSADDSSSAEGVPTSNGDMGSGTVTVYAHDFTENFEFHVVGADDTQELIAWLQMNGYNVSDNMTPVMDIYNDADGRFLALKLQAGRDVTDIVPIQMTYPGTHPMIPIQLTAVAAQPFMGILVFIVADTPFEPDNYDLALPDTTEIQFDANSQTSYFDWVARASDESEGRIFVGEYVGTNPASGLLDGQYLSRYYTRLSPENMTLDPVFRAAALDFRINNALDLRSRQSLYSCQSVVPERLPSPCAFNYCGRGGQCTIINNDAACICPADSVAQRVASPDGSRFRVACVPATNPYGITADAGGAGTEFDPCADVNCGRGLCVLKSGFPTCQCESGAAACIDVANGDVFCETAPADAVTFGPGAGSEAAPITTTQREVEPDTHRAALAYIWLPLFLGGGAVWRRRRH